MGATASSIPDDCVILVTGASRGIGKVFQNSWAPDVASYHHSPVVTRFAWSILNRFVKHLTALPKFQHSYPHFYDSVLWQEFPRAYVYGAARSGVKVESIGDDCQLLAMDVTSDQSVSAAIALILRKHKVRDYFLLVTHHVTLGLNQRIDVLVNNAGINQANVLRALNSVSAMIPMNTNFAGVIRVNEKVRIGSSPSPERSITISTAGYSQYDRVGQVTDAMFSYS
jgi:NAD(P)-dependent dehydrogenase (short-subunit alcohol dehydrogenase family)